MEVALLVTTTGRTDTPTPTMLVSPAQAVIHELQVVEVLRQAEVLGDDALLVQLGEEAA